MLKAFWTIIVISSLSLSPVLVVSGYDNPNNYLNVFDHVSFIDKVTRNSKPFNCLAVSLRGGDSGYDRDQIEDDEEYDEEYENEEEDEGETLVEDDDDDDVGDDENAEDIDDNGDNEEAESVLDVSEEEDFVEVTVMEEAEGMKEEEENNDDFEDIVIVGEEEINENQAVGELFDDAQEEGEALEEKEEEIGEDEFHDALQDNDLDVQEGAVNIEPPSMTQVIMEEERLLASEVIDDGDESSAFVDRMELADAYDEGETTTSGDIETTAAAAAPAPTTSTLQRSDVVPVGGGGNSSNSGMGVPEEVDDNATKVNDKKPIFSESTKITPEMKEILINDLYYTAKEVSNMKPSVAIEVIDKKLHRPNEGMPPSFYVDEASIKKRSSNGLRKKATAVLAVAVAVGVSALAAFVFANNDGEFVFFAPKSVESSEMEETKSNEEVESSSPPQPTLEEILESMKAEQMKLSPLARLQKSISQLVKKFKIVIGIKS